MKKYIFPLFLASVILITFGGCTKNSSSTPLTYTVAGPYDVTVQQNEDTTFTMAVGVGYVSGKQETVTLTPGTLPSGVTVTPSTASGTGSFASTFTFHVKVGTTGTYPISITSSSASTSNKTTSFNLIVAAPGSGGGTSGTFSYTVNGITSISIPQYTDTTITLPLSIALGGGTQETVTLTPATPPTGVTITPASQSGIPSFTTSFSMHVAISTPGTYPVTIKSSSASTTTKSYTFNIIVTGSTTCAASVVGTYSAVDDCSPVAGNATEPYPITVTAVAGSGTQISIPIYYIGLTADLNCSAGTMTTEAHSYGDFDIVAGTGTFTSNQIIVHYSLTNGITTTCATTLTR